MTFSNVNALDLLGKQVSFVHSIKFGSHVHSSDYSGTVTNIVISLTSGPEISINDGDFYILSEITDLKVL